MVNKQGYITSGVTKQVKSPIPNRFGAFLLFIPQAEKIEEKLQASS